MSPPSGRDRAEVPPEPCIIGGCASESIRHLTLTEARRGFPDLPEKGRRAPLCREHYRAWKKATKESRTLDRLAW